MNITRARELAAQAWCLPQTSNKVMDVDLANAFAEILVMACQLPASPSGLEDTIRTAINQHSAENGSDTPDFILARYLLGCLTNFNSAVTTREIWYGRKTDAIPEDHPDAPKAKA